jgi:hypothetical protein
MRARSTRAGAAPPSSSKRNTSRRSFVSEASSARAPKTSSSAASKPVRTSERSPSTERSALLSRGSMARTRSAVVGAPLDVVKVRADMDRAHEQPYLQRREPPQPWGRSPRDVLRGPAEPVPAGGIERRPRLARRLERMDLEPAQRARPGRARPRPPALAHSPGAGTRSTCCAGSAPLPAPANGAARSRRWSRGARPCERVDRVFSTCSSIDSRRTPPVLRLAKVSPPSCAAASASATTAASSSRCSRKAISTTFFEARRASAASCLSADDLPAAGGPTSATCS